MENLPYDSLQLGVKGKSKREIYNILATEGKVYLPPYKDSHYKFISQVLVGEKEVS